MRDFLVSIGVWSLAMQNSLRKGEAPNLYVLAPNSPLNHN